MTWWLLLVCAAVIVYLLVGVSSAKPITVEPLADAPIDAIEYFWRPG